MEVSRITQELKYLENNGCTLNSEERTQLDIAFETLKGDLQTNFTQLFFWDKIRGR